MVTRKQTLFFLDTLISVLFDIREILAIVPTYPTLLLHLTMFKDFLKEQYKDA